MDESKNRPQQTPDKLNYCWAPSALMAYHARCGSDFMEKLRLGHGLYTRDQFADALLERKFEVLYLPNDCLVLAGFGTYEDGYTMVVLTCSAEIEHAEEALLEMEKAARARYAKAILTIGRKGWRPLVRKHGYVTSERLVMRKLLS